VSVTKSASEVGSLQGNSPSPSWVPNEGFEKTQAQYAPQCLSELQSGALRGGGESILMCSEQREGLKTAAPGAELLPHSTV